jgi:hypothetical protein
VALLYFCNVLPLQALPASELETLLHGLVAWQDANLSKFIDVWKSMWSLWGRGGKRGGGATTGPGRAGLHALGIGIHQLLPSQSELGWNSCNSMCLSTALKFLAWPIVCNSLAITYNVIACNWLACNDHVMLVI